MIKINIKHLLTLSLSIFFFGCSAQQSFNNVTSDHSNDTKIAAKFNQELSEGKPYSTINYERYITSKLFVASKPVIKKLSETHEKLKKQYTLNQTNAVDISQIAQELSLLSGIKFRLAPEVIDGINIKSSTSNFSADAAGTINKNTLNEKLNFNTSMRPQWVKTKLLDILNQIESQLSLSWKYSIKNNTIDIYRYKTKAYTIHVPTEKENHISQMSNESLSDSDSGTKQGSNVTTTLEINSDFWFKIEQSIDAVLSIAGRYSVHPDIFTIYVTDTELVHEMLEQLIDGINNEQLKQVVFNVDIYRLSSNSSDIYGLNFDAIYQTANTAINLTTPRSIATGLYTLTGQNQQASSKYKGSQFFLDALSGYGKAERLDHYKRVTLNNRIAPVMIFKNTPYLRSVGSVIGDGQSQSEAELTDLITGFNLMLRPHLINTNEVLLTLSLDRKSAGDFDLISAGPDVFLERPNIEGDSMYSQSIMKNNQTMVLTGYVSKNSNASSSGVGNSSAWWAGGRQDVSRDHSIIVITVNISIL